jgi:GDPmannose 4,6-dehydratase
MIEEAGAHRRIVMCGAHLGSNGAFQRANQMAVAFPARRKRAFVTGITGQDGSQVAELLLSNNYEVHELKRCSSGFNTEPVDRVISDWHEPERGFFSPMGDPPDLTRLSKRLYRIAPDEIYQLGAQSHVRVSFDVPEYNGEITALGAARLLDTIRETGIPARFYNAASREMFGQACDCPQTEITSYRPRGPYSGAKLYSYRMTARRGRADGLVETAEWNRSTLVRRTLQPEKDGLRASRLSVLGVDP